MSQPPSHEPYSLETGGQPSPGAPVPTPAFAVPAQRLEYVMPQYHGRPGLITAIGILSIVIASLSIIWSLFTVLQGAGYYMMSVMSSSVAAAQARATATGPRMAPPMAVQVSVGGIVPTVPAGGPLGMNAPEREAAVAALTGRQALTPARKRHLDAILASAGKQIRPDRLTDSGTMDEMRSGEMPPDYFVTPAGRLEIFNDRAVFFPSDGSPTVRASAPPPQPGATEPPAAAQAQVETEVDAGEDGDITLPDAVATTGPAPAIGAALSAAEVQSIVAQAQSLSSNGLNAAQVQSLSAVLSAPGQQFVQPGGAQGSVLSAYAPAGSPAVVQFSDGGSVTIAPAGNVTAMSNAPIMPTFNFKPLTLGLMIGSGVGSLALAVYLLVCGILTLRQSPRARRLHLIYSVIKIPLAVLAGLSAAWVTNDMMASITPAGAGGGMMGYSLFSGAMPIVLGCAYPIALLIALNVKSVREYYVGNADPAPGTTFPG